MRTIVLLIPLLALSCGKKSGGSKSSAPGPEVSSSSEGPSSWYVADAQKLPECTEARDTALAYVVSEKAFYVCSAGSWTVVEIKGEKGDPGEAVDSFKEQLADTGLYVVMDKDQKLVGYTDSETSSNPVRLTKDGFKAVVSSSAITGDTVCYFLQASCAGDCYTVPFDKSAARSDVSICTPVQTSVATVSANPSTANPFLSRFEGGSCVPMTTSDPAPSSTNKYKKGECQDFTAPFTVKKASETVN